MGFYQDWILITGSKDGTVQMYDLSVDGAGDRSTFMAQKNFFTIINKEKYIEDQNEIIDLIVSSCGLIFVVDKFKFGRTYSVFHGQKVFKATPGIYFSLESLTGGKPTKSEFQVKPKPVMTVAHSKKNINLDTLCIKTTKVESEDDSKAVGSCLLLFKYNDIIIGNYEVLQAFIRQGMDRAKIFDVFRRLR